MSAPERLDGILSTRQSVADLLRQAAVGLAPRQQAVLAGLPVYTAEWYPPGVVDLWEDGELVARWSADGGPSDA